MADRGWATEPQAQTRRPPSSAHVLPASVRAVADYKEAEGHVLITITVRPRVAMTCPLRHRQHRQAAGWSQQGPVFDPGSVSLSLNAITFLAKASCVLFDPERAASGPIAASCRALSS